MLQNKQQGYVGNSPCWYEKGGSGYTCNVDNAELFEFEEAKRHVGLSPEKYVAYTEAEVRECSYLVADMQPLRRLEPSIGRR